MFSFHPENVGAFLLGNRALNMKNAKDDETGWFKMGYHKNINI